MSPATVAPDAPLPQDLAQEVELVETVGGVAAYRLRSNGLQILLLEQHAAPVATFMVTYRVGSRNEPSGLTGATHFLEHLMFKGTERFHKTKGTSIFQTLQRVGAQVNATTWLDRTNYFELLPSRHLPLAIEIEADRMRGALIAPDDLDNERTVILNEMDRGESEPMRVLYQAVHAAAFTAHPYRHPTIGWRSDVERVQPEGLRSFYDRYYWPDTTTVSVIGAFERDEVLRLISEHYGSIARSEAAQPEFAPTAEPEQQGERRVTIRRPGQLGLVMAAWKQPDALHEDTDALDLLAMVLAAGKGSRLYRRLTNEGLTVGLYADAARLRDPGLFYVFATLAPGRTHEEVEAALFEEVQHVQQEGVTADELERARGQLKALERFSRDGPYAIASQLNEAIAAGDWRLYATYLDRIARVTPEDVQHAAQRYLVEDGRTVGRFVPA